MKCLFAFLFTLLSLLGYSCSCAIAQGFCSYDEPDTLESVFEIRVLDSIYSHSYYDYKDAIVTQHYFGPALQTDTITIRIARGSTCEYFGAVGSNKIILKLAQFESDSIASYPIYQFWLCLVNWAAVEGDSVRGLFDESQGLYYQHFSRMHKSDFLEWYPNCALGTDVQELLIREQEDIVISPNPSNGLFQISNRSDHRFKYDVYSDSGEKVYTGQTSPSYSSRVVLDDFPPGIYFVRFRNESSSFIKKLLKI